MRYFFGVYHWQRHVPQLLGTAAGVLGMGIGVLVGGLSGIALAVLGAIVAAVAADGLGLLFKPSPWAVDRDRFERLAEHLPFTDAGTVVDIGCGTGRSVVGFASTLAGDTTVIGLDPFDSEIIGGNSPRLARWNARRAGIDLEAVRADGATIPLRDDSADVVTIVQVLHDLPEETARGIVREARRICRPDGRVGLIELPLVNDSREVSPEHWQRVVESAGLTVETKETLPWKDGKQKILLTAHEPP